MMFLKRVLWVLCLGAGLVCASCLGMSVPKGAGVDPSTSGIASRGGQMNSSGRTTDQGLVDTWELLHQVDDQGKELRPKESIRTLIEFTGNGQVIFNRMDKDESDAVKSRTGKYTVDRDEITITDDVGNTVKWPFKLVGDTLVITMPEAQKKFHLRRFR